MTKIRLRYIHEFVDRHGKVRRYARVPGRDRVPLPGLPGGAEFMAAYARAIDGMPTIEIGSSKTMPGTFSALLVTYYQSEAFLALSPVTRTARRNILENFRKAHGDKRVAHLQTRHLDEMLATKKPFAKRAFLKAMRGLIGFARNAKPRPWLSHDPTKDVELIPVQSDGHVTWSEEHISAYEAKHPIGTKARLAMALMLYTGCRIGDVVALGRQHIKNGWLTYTQEKNGNSRFRKPVTLSIPVHPDLQRIIDSTPNDQLTFLTTGYGKPHSKKAFGRKIREWCDAAACPDVSSHGLRKAISRRMAEARKSHFEIMSVTGHRTLSEVEKYTRAASQQKLAATAMDFKAGVNE